MPEIINAPSPLPTERPQLFLAGTIEMGESLAWQPEAAALAQEAGWTVLNPRREGVTSWEPSAADPDFAEQVNWELDAQDQADRIVMNLVAGSLSPISLLELGLYAASGKLVVICPPEFWRAGNVEIVCQRYHIPLVATIEEAIDPGLVTKQPSTRVTQLHPSLFRDPVKDGSFLVRGSTDAPHVPGSIADELAITGFVRETRVTSAPGPSQTASPAMSESEIREALSLAAPRLWRDYGGQLRYQYTEVLDAFAAALYSALKHRAGLNQGISSRYPYTHIGSGPSLDMSPAAAMERAIRVHETYVATEGPESPKSAQDLETWLREKALDQPDSDQGDSEALSLIAAADMIALRHRVGQSTSPASEEPTRPQTLRDLITEVFGGGAEDQTIEGATDQGDETPPTEVDDTLATALRLAADHQHITLYPGTEFDDCALCYLIEATEAPREITDRKAAAFDKIVAVLWDRDHLEQIALALDLTNEVLSKVEYADNPDLTKRVNESAGGTDMQDDLREIAKIIDEVTNTEPQTTEAGPDAFAAAANYSSVSTFCFVCGATAPGMDPEGWPTWTRTSTILPYFLHSCPKHSTHEGLWDALPPSLDHSILRDALVKIAQYDPRWHALHATDAPSRATLIAIAYDALRPSLQAPNPTPGDESTLTPLQRMFGTTSAPPVPLKWDWQKRTGPLSPDGDEFQAEALYDGSSRTRPRWNIRRTFEGTWVISCDSNEFYFYQFTHPFIAAGAAEAIDAILRDAKAKN
jgi:hypothetical protein